MLFDVAMTGLIWVTDRIGGGLYVLEPEPWLAGLMQQCADPRSRDQAAYARRAQPVPGRAAALRFRGSPGHNPSGPVAGRDDREPRPVPGVHAAGQVDHVPAVAGQHGGSPRGPGAGPADGDHRPVRRQVPQPGREAAQRDVPGLGCVPGLPFGVFPHVQQDGALGLQVTGLGRAHLGPGREQPSHPLMLPAPSSCRLR